MVRPDQEEFSCFFFGSGAEWCASQRWRWNRGRTLRPVHQHPGEYGIDPVVTCAGGHFAAGLSVDDNVGAACARQQQYTTNCVDSDQLLSSCIFAIAWEKSWNHRSTEKPLMTSLVAP